MSKYQNIAVIYGSDSSEWEVSCRSGEFTAASIDETTYNVYEVFARFGVWQLVALKRRNAMRVTFPEGARPEVSKNDFSVNIYGEKIRFDYAFIMQHGSPGETGQLQGYLEMLDIPFSSCSSFVTAVAFDKYSCKSYLRDASFVKMAADTFVREGDDLEAFASNVVKKIGLPLFVKPTNGGSSFGITKVKREEDIVGAVRYAFTESPTVIVEKAIVGEEFTCAAYYDGTAIQALPVIQIVSDNEYFDYEAKYNGFSREICPAPIGDDLRELIQRTTQLIYAHMGCKGLVRVDYIKAEDGLYFLEMNIIPGMTNASLVPKMVRAAGINLTDFLSTIIENT